MALLRLLLRQSQTLRDPGYHSEEQVRNGREKRKKEMEEKEKQMDVGSVKRGKLGNLQVAKNSLV